MAEIRRRSPLLEALVTGTRLSWYVASSIIAGVLLLLLLLAAFLDGRLTQHLDWIFWRTPLLPLAIVLYVLFIYPLMKKLRERAIVSLTSLVDTSLDSQEIIADIFSSPKRWWELTSVLVGVIFCLTLSQPWFWVKGALEAYGAGMSALMFGILGWLVYDGLDGTIRVSRMERHYLKLDISAVGKLVPVANLSLGISLAFVGGISISIAFQPLSNLQHWQTFTFYIGLILVALVIFFLSMWSTHAAIVRTKKTELSSARQNLETAFHELKLSAEEGSTTAKEKVYSAVAAWAAYERRLQEVPEWPYSAPIARRLVASVLLPGAVYLLKLILGLHV